jgi:hypothetical protein
VTTVLNLSCTVEGTASTVQQLKIVESPFIPVVGNLKFTTTDGGATCTGFSNISAGINKITFPEAVTKLSITT